MTGVLMGVDALAVYLVLPNIKRKMLLALWTGLLHMVFPVIGYFIGGVFHEILGDIGSLLSVILLFCIGLQLLLSDPKNPKFNISPIFLAISVSIDTFSVSLSFGMLKLHIFLFILSAGIGTFVLSYIALSFSNLALKVNQKKLYRFAGIMFILIGLWSYAKL